MFAPPSGSGVNPAQPVRALVALERAADPRLEALQRTLTTMVGSTQSVAVLARLQDGGFLVRVADIALRMPLPAGTQPGAQLNMTLLAATPQPTFLLGESRIQASLSTLSANAALLSNAAGKGALLQSGAGNGAELSPTARLLAQVLHSAASAPASQALVNTTPLLPQGAPDPAQLAAQLRQVIAKSGLFYESHVAEWALGKRPLAELQAEPQARNPAGTLATDPASAQLINLQLATQESKQLIWQGLFGPGQPFHWEIKRDDEAAPQEASDPDEASWHSGLRLRFAALGEIDAQVTLRGSRLQITLQAGSSAATALRQHAPALEQALGAAGNTLTALRIGATEAP